MLGTLANLSADAADAYSRLMEIGMEQKNWEQVAENGRRYLAVYPMLPAAYWRLGRADEELGREEPAIDSYRRLLLLDPRTRSTSTTVWQSSSSSGTPWPPRGTSWKRSRTPRASARATDCC